MNLLLRCYGQEIYRLNDAKSICPHLLSKIFPGGWGNLQITLINVSVAPQLLTEDNISWRDDLAGIHPPVEGVESAVSDTGECLPSFQGNWANPCDSSEARSVFYFQVDAGFW